MASNSPFADLEGALQVLTKDCQVIPATGQALSDLMIPDIDEQYDGVHLGDDADAVLKATAEEDPPGSQGKSLMPLHRETDHVFRYFLDGSAFTYYLGNVLSHDRHSPVHIAQVGAAAVLRDDNGFIGGGNISDRRLVLLVDRNSLPDAVWTKLEQVVTNKQSCILIDTSSSDTYADGVHAGKEPRSRAFHKANWQMRKTEEAIAQRVADALGPDEWMIIDGGLGNEYIRDDWAKPTWRHVGVIKSTHKGLRFQVGAGKDQKNLSVFGLLTALPAKSRTAAWLVREGKVATWFVRLRGPEHLDFPIMGTVRVELPLDQAGTKVSTALIDRLSAALIAERSVTPYGTDARWHSHLYGIHAAELFIRNVLFASKPVLTASLRWPGLSSA